MDGGKIEGWVDRMMNIAKEDRRIEEYKGRSRKRGWNDTGCSD